MPGLVKRARNAYRALVRGDGVYDQSPISPGPKTHDSSKRTPFNVQVTDATGTGRLGALEILHWFATTFTPATVCIQKRQEQIAGLKFGWRAKQGEDPESAEVKAQIAAAEEYATMRGGLGGPGSLWRTWTERIVWSALAIDATPVWVDRRAPGEMRHQLISGRTITVETDPAGWIPEPPVKAYHQWKNGEKVGSYDTDEMHYFVLKPGPAHPYGFPPCEGLIYQIAQWMFAENWNVEFFTSGVKEDGYWEMAEGLSPDQWTTFQQFIETVAPETPTKQGKGKPVPHGTAFHEWRKRSEMEWEQLMRFVLQISATMFGLNAATIGFAGEEYKVAQEGQIEASRRWGLVPLMNFVLEVMAALAHDQEWDLIQPEFEPEETNKTKLAAAIKASGTSVLTRNDARRMLGQDILEGRLVNCLYEILPSGIVVLFDPESPDEPYMLDRLIAEVEGDGEEESGPVPPELAQLPPGAPAPPEEDPAVIGAVGQAARVDLRKWRDKTVRRWRPGGQAARFESVAIPGPVRAFVTRGLQHAQTVDEVRAVFQAAVLAPVEPAPLSVQLRETRQLVEGEIARREFLQGGPHVDNTDPGS